MSENSPELTVLERRVVEMLLAADFPGAEGYRAQLATATVTWRCTCGCLAFDVEVDESLPAADDQSVGVSALSEEQQVHLGLEAESGYLRGVTLMWFGDEENRIAPDLTTFEVTVTTLMDRWPVRPSWWRKLNFWIARRRLRRQTGRDLGEATQRQST